MNENPRVILERGLLVRASAGLDWQDGMFFLSDADPRNVIYLGLSGTPSTDQITNDLRARNIWPFNKSEIGKLP